MHAKKGKFRIRIRELELTIRVRHSFSLSRLLAGNYARRDRAIAERVLLICRATAAKSNAYPNDDTLPAKMDRFASAFLANRVPCDQTPLHFSSRARTSVDDKI